MGVEDLLHARSILSVLTSNFRPAQPLVEVLPVVLAVLVVLVVLTICHYWRHAFGSIPIPASVPILPGGIPVLGHSIPLFFNFHRLHHWLLESTQQMGEGKTYAFSLPLIPTTFMVTDPVCLEYMLKKRSDNYIKGHRFIMNLAPILGHGIFTSDGPQWYWQRKLATNIFSVKSFKSYIDTVFAQKMQLLTGVVAQAAHTGCPIDLHDLMYRFTLDSFGQIGFGVDPGCLTTKEKVPFAAAFDTAQMIVNERFWVPAWPLLELLTGQAWVLGRNLAVIKRFARDIVDKRRQQMAAAAAGAADAGPPEQDVRNSRDNNSSSNISSRADGHDAGGGLRDLLSLFMEAEGPEGKPLTTQELIDTVINFIIAGRDTTAQALSWTFYLLMQHPEVEQKLLAEIREVLCHAQSAGVNATTADTAGGGADNVDEGAGEASMLRPSYDQLRRLQYALAVFKEALRLYPSVPEDVKYAVQRDVLPDGSVVPAGTQLIYSPYVVNRMERFWGPDAHEFRPERWLEMEKQPSPYNYLTFNAGPRLCLGQRLAELEGVFVLTGLMSTFRFRQVVPGAQVEYNLSSTMPMKQGLQVYVDRRR